MLIDLTVKVTEERWKEVFRNEQMSSLGHLGTHFDVMDREFDLENTRRPGCVVEAAGIRGRDVEPRDLGDRQPRAGDFVLFHTGFLREAGYGTERYLRSHPQLSRELIDLLLDRRVSLIGVDAAGIRRGAEHTPTDRYCAKHGVFIVENLTNLDLLLERPGAAFDVLTFPIRFEGLSGLPCRVVAELRE
jgi:kynurenine formamidase